MPLQNKADIARRRYDDLQDFLKNFHTVDFQLGTVGSIGGVLLVRQ